MWLAGSGRLFFLLHLRVWGWCGSVVGGMLEWLWVGELPIDLGNGVTCIFLNSISEIWM